MSEINNQQIRRGEDSETRNSKYRKNESKPEEGRYTENAQVALKYKRGEIASANVKVEILLPHDEKKTTFETQKFVGSSTEELFRAIRELGNVIKNNDLLPENFPSGTTGAKKGRVSALILPRLKKPKAVDTADSAEVQLKSQNKIDEYEKFKFREKINRLVVFRAYEKIFGTQETKDVYLDSLNEALDQYEIDNHGNTDPPEFYTDTELEKHVAKVVRSILPRDALKKQTKYLQHTKKPTSMPVRPWIRRIYEINNLIKLFPGNTKNFNNKQVNEDFIIENLTEATLTEFRRNPEYRQILTNDKDNQPSLQDIIDVLEQIEENEVKPSAKIKTHNKEHFDGRSKKKNMCSKPGHDHEWKNCPENPYKDSWKTKSPNKESQCVERAPSPETFIVEQY